MHSLPFIVVLFLLNPAVALSRNSSKARKAGQSSDKPVAKMTICYEDECDQEKLFDEKSYNRRMERALAVAEYEGFNASKKDKKDISADVIYRMVDDFLVEYAAKKNSIQVSDDEITSRMEAYVRRFGERKDFLSFLEQTSQEKEDILFDIKQDILRDKLRDKLESGIELTDMNNENTLKDHYRRNKNKYTQNAQIRASQILIRFDPKDRSADKKSKLKKAKRLVQMLTEEGADFATLARENSEGSAAKLGGDLGRFGPGKMSAAFDDAAFKAQAGQIVGPVKTKEGYLVIKVSEKIPARMLTFEEAKPRIRALLRDDGFDTTEFRAEFGEETILKQGVPQRYITCGIGTTGCSDRPRKGACFHPLWGAYVCDR